jgi:hypothetical protein
VRATGTWGIGIGATLLATMTPSPAAAELPGSTQPGAQQVLPGNLIILRNVPARNAIIPGAGTALTAPTAPSSTVFAFLQGVGAPLSDSQAASITGSVSPGQGGRDVATAVGGVLESRPVGGGIIPQTAGGGGLIGGVGGTVQSAVGSISGILGTLGGSGH